MDLKKHFSVLRLAIRSRPLHRGPPTAALLASRGVRRLGGTGAAGPTIDFIELDAENCSLITLLTSGSLQKFELPRARLLRIFP